MKLGLDTNVLVYSHLPGFPESAKVRTFLLNSLREASNELFVTPLILHELVHVITDSRRFEPPVSMAEATAIARSYISRSNVECLPVDDAAIRLALNLLDTKPLGRKRIADTLIVATLLGNGVDRLVTCNPRDFSLFEGLEVIDPRVA